MSNWRLENWLLVGVAVGAAGLTAVTGLREYMRATAEILHPSLQQIPSTREGTPGREWMDAVDRGRDTVRAHVSERNLPGVSVAVGIDGHLVWAEGFGWADLETRSPVTPDTRFRLGTASIALTSAAAGLLVERGRLDLDRDVHALLPDVPGQGTPITIRQLMAHTAGIGADGGDEGPLFGEHCERPADALRHVLDGPLRFAPGSDFRFSSYGWILVSGAIEVAAGEPFLRVMRKRVFEPSAMADTVADGTSTDENRATSYFPRFGADPRLGADVMRPIDLSCYAGGSVFLSTAPDLVRFGLALAHGALLRADTVSLLQTPQHLPSGRETGYGLGWQVQQMAFDGRETLVIGHDGTLLGGMAASLMTVPERRLVVAVLANISYARTSDLAASIAGAFLRTGTGG